MVVFPVGLDGFASGIRGIWGFRGFGGGDGGAGAFHGVVVDPFMEPALQAADKRRYGSEELGHGDGAILELLLIEEADDGGPDQFIEFAGGDGFSGKFGYGDGIEAIGNHHNGYFDGLRPGPAVAVDVLFDAVFAFFIVLKAFLIIEVTDESGAVVLLDELDDVFWEALFATSFDAEADMVADDHGAEFGGEFFVELFLFRGDLIFDEVLGAVEFSDVVVEGTGAGEEGFGSDGVAGGFREFSDIERVFVGSWGFGFEFVEDGVVAGGEFEESPGGALVEEALEDGDGHLGESVASKSVEDGGDEELSGVEIGGLEESDGGQGEEASGGDGQAGDGQLMEPANAMEGESADEAGEHADKEGIKGGGDMGGGKEKWCDDGENEGDAGVESDGGDHSDHSDGEGEGAEEFGAGLRQEAANG